MSLVRYGIPKTYNPLDVQPIVLYQTRRIHLTGHPCIRQNVDFSKNSKATRSEKIRQNDNFSTHLPTIRVLTYFYYVYDQMNDFIT